MLKVAFEKAKNCNGKSFSELLINNQIILEKSEKTINLAIKIIGDKEIFLKRFDNNAYDLIRGNTSLRVFGVYDPKKYKFFLLQFDFNHSSRD